MSKSNKRTRERPDFISFDERSRKNFLTGLHCKNIKKKSEKEKNERKERKRMKHQKRISKLNEWIKIFETENSNNQCLQNGNTRMKNVKEYESPQQHVTVVTTGSKIV